MVHGGDTRRALRRSLNGNTRRCALHRHAHTGSTVNKCTNNHLRPLEANERAPPCPSSPGSSSVSGTAPWSSYRAINRPRIDPRIFPLPLESNDPCGYGLNGHSSTKLSGINTRRLRYELMDRPEESNLDSSSRSGSVRCSDAHSSYVCTWSVKNCSTSRNEMPEAATTSFKNGVNPSASLYCLWGSYSMETPWCGNALGVQRWSRKLLCLWEKHFAAP